MAEKWRGIFPVLMTPFEEDRSLDEASLRREVELVIRAGAHGFVTPVNTSEFSLLADDERQRVAEIVVDQARGRVPAVIGVAAPYVTTAEKLARHAREIGAAGVIAMPPYVLRVDEQSVRQYYERIGKAADGLPVVVQNAGGDVGVAMTPEVVARLAQQVPAIRYVKEETKPSTHRISALLRLAGDRLDGVFGGSGGRALVDELKRGACGLMSGAHICDAQVRVYELLRAGDEAGARAAFVRQLPLQSLWGELKLGVAKEVLRRRGIFRTAVCRGAAIPLDAADHAEIDFALSLVQEDLVAEVTA